MSKEHPMLFSGPMMRANLAGAKDVTRRLIKNPDYLGCTTGDCPHSLQTQCDDAMASECKYRPGDTIWAREAFQFTVDNRGQSVIVYRADDAAAWLLADDNGEGDLCGVEGKCDRSRCGPVTTWRPSIHMPRWACRFTAEVVDVRAERLQKITEDDAMREGVEHGNVAGHDVDINGETWNGSYRRAYAQLWDSINGAGSWSANPWVWRIKYRNPNKEHRA